MLRGTNISYISEKNHKSMLSTSVKFGDVLLNITGASIGRSCVFSEERKIANVNQHVCIVRPNKKISSFYLSCLFESRIGQEKIWLRQNGSSREGLNFADLKAFTFPIPPIKEQQQIEEMISSILGIIKEASNSIKKEQESLKEFVSITIANAVTGKIKV